MVAVGYPDCPTKMCRTSAMVAMTDIEMSAIIGEITGTEIARILSVPLHPHHDPVDRA